MCSCQSISANSFPSMDRAQKDTLKSITSRVNNFFGTCFLEICYLTLAGSEATSCRAAIRTAASVVSDLGETAAQQSPGLTALARCSQTHSERDVHRVVVNQYKLALPVEMTTIPKVPGMMYSGEIKVLSLKHWVQFMVQFNLWHILCGLRRADENRERKILLEFWRRYRLLRPTHSIWELSDSGQLDLSRTAPLMCHGDEGRGRKKSGFLFMSWYSYLGFGTHEANSSRKHRPFLAMRLNFGDSTFLHRLVTSVLPKMVKDECALRAILQFVADDACTMLMEGVRSPQGHVYKACCLQIVGDWQWLVKAGQLKRSYANCGKRPATAATTPKGICHLCQADQRGVPWEGYRAQGLPAWWNTRYLDNPFDGEPALNQIPYIPHQRPSFYTFDIFHSFHLGVGKSLAAGCLALASAYMWSSKVDDRLEELTLLWLTWCEENHVPTHLYSLTRSMLGWPDTKTYANGQWSKGHVTTNLCLFFEAWASSQDLRDDGLMRLALETCSTINRCFRKMYASDVWLDRPGAEEISNDGLAFLHGYKALATQCFRTNTALFPHMPKGHSLDHIFSEMKADLSVQGPHRPEHFLNPLNHSVQISEDWVGRASRISRRTGPAQAIQRTLERILKVCHARWREEGFITW